MIGEAHPAGPGESPPALDADFTQRLEASLWQADVERRRRVQRRRAKAAIPYILLLAPIVAWRLTVVSPGTSHVAIDALTWLTFLIDVGMHMDTVLLSYLNLQVLPSLIGVLLFILVPAWLLTAPRDDG